MESTGAGVSILIAEDSPTQAEQLRFLLEEEGYTVEVAENGRVALERLQQHRPTLIITDIVMPEMDGYQLCAAVKADAGLKDIPVVIVTSLAGMQEVAKSLECGADNLVRKPYEPRMLLSRLNYILLNLHMRKTSKVQMGMEVMLDGKTHYINSDRQQIVDMLLSTYEEAMHMNDELKSQQQEIVHSNQLLRGLYGVAEGLINADSTDAVCQSALRGLMALSRYRAGWICLGSNAGTTRNVLVGKVPPELVAWLAAQQSGDDDLPWAPGARFHEAPLPQDGASYPLVSMPLLVGARRLGRLHVLPAPAYQPEQEDLEILGAVGSQMTVALERVSLMASLAQRAAQLEAANRELESFSYSVSHDLRSPLRAVDGFARMLENTQQGHLDEEGRRLIQVIRDSSKKMGTLIDSLLAFSRLGSAAIVPMAVDMTTLAQDCFNALGEETAGRELQWSLAPLPEAWGDVALIRQVWANLLSNAIKYSGKNPQASITVTGERADKECIYTVADNGAGFDMRYYEQLFGVFHRLHGVEEFPGTGIGLANVQRIIVRHGGRIWAEGEVGVGATFHFSLPAPP
ncbi:Phytochrome-like protein cph1 [Andreprevotia sp. IGB-42]|uniref:response regulator n=1 Tax=Andreprevotia sp. IGB-42 TaxID=2497473 RepID=UPI00135AA0DD|nr:response regulator [Andreprevotia sp. IGB-42]KAF0815329.1 Phytochrome-like protein cph1 [Andreprevotia sp. IGB-42]